MDRFECRKFESEVYDQMNYPCSEGNVAYRQAAETIIKADVKVLETFKQLDM